MKPHWTAPIYKTNTGEDFLGLRMVQTNILGYLLPGIITITPRARYYAFYSWLLVEYEQQHPPGWSLKRFIKHREQIFALANIAYNTLVEGSSEVAGLTGSRRLIPHWQTYQSQTAVPLTVNNYVQAPHGGFDAYTGVFDALGAARKATDGQNDWEILSKGQRVAEAYAEAIANTTYYRERHQYDKATLIPCQVLEEYGQHCHLSYPGRQQDALPTLELLLALESPPASSPDGLHPLYLGNMRGTVGLILDMIDQPDGRLDRTLFREHIMHGLCEDYPAYRPARPLRPILAQWQQFQLRELYVYTLYALWTYFLHWLRRQGPQPLEAFYQHLAEVMDVARAGAAVSLTLPAVSFNEQRLQEHLEILLSAAGIGEGDWSSRCQSFAQRSQTALNEQTIYRALAQTSPDNPAVYLGLAWLLLAAIYLRLSGMPQDTPAWYWAKFGSTRRRALARFAADLDQQAAAGATPLAVLQWLFRDYVIAQHTIAALDKWQQRDANTFHFSHENGLFSWIRDGGTSLSQSRFQQAYDILADLRLFEVAPESGRPQLTALGQQTLQRILEGSNE